MKSEGTRSARECYDAIVARLGREQMGVVAAKMFGMPCVKADSKMFVGFSEEAQVFDPSKMGRPNLPYQDSESPTLALRDCCLLSAVC
jgi:hypothetical protein